MRILLGGISYRDLVLGVSHSRHCLCTSLYDYLIMYPTSKCYYDTRYTSTSRHCCFLLLGELDSLQGEVLVVMLLTSRTY